MRKFFEINKVNTKKLIWIPNGVELNRFYHVKSEREKQDIISYLKISPIINVKDYIIIYVGYMFLKQKVLGMMDYLYGFNLFLNNLKETEKKSIKLLYVGDGQYRELLEKEIVRLNLENNAYILGERKNIEKFYAISDQCALTSYIEGFPTVLMEAIASDVPCISSDVGEVNEILTKDSIVPVGDKQAIALKIQKFYENKTFRDNNLIKSKEKVKRFDWIKIAQKFRDLYRQVITFG